MTSPKIDQNLRKILEARHHDPFSVLGRHKHGKQTLVRAHVPNCAQIAIAEGEHSMQRIPDTDIFEWRGDAGQLPEHYRLIWQDKDHREHIAHDPYDFPPQLSDFDLHLFGEGKHWHAYRILGAHPKVVDDVAGVLFAVWAPNAERVSVAGDFNRWDGRIHPMRVRGDSGVWELFIPDLEPGALYKFEIRNRNSGDVFLKSDPYGQAFEQRPQTASIVVDESPFNWHDQDWMAKRETADWLHAPLSIYVRQIL